MSKLIMFKGMGINGKSHIIDELLKVHPSIVHLPQVTREFINENPENDSVANIFEYYHKKMSEVVIEPSKTYVTERSALDYLLYYVSINNFKMDPAEIRVFDGAQNFMSACIESEKELLSRFDSVDIQITINEDLDWLKNYFEELSKNHVHKIFYVSRGVYITNQDRWLRAFEQYSNLAYYKYQSAISRNIFKNFPVDNHQLALKLIRQYE